MQADNPHSKREPISEALPRTAVRAVDPRVEKSRRCGLRFPIFFLGPTLSSSSSCVSNRSLLSTVNVSATTTQMHASSRNSAPFHKCGVRKALVISLTRYIEKLRDATLDVRDPQAWSHHCMMESPNVASWAVIVYHVCKKPLESLSFSFHAKCSSCYTCQLPYYH
jgi:hypothetical protein